MIKRNKWIATVVTITLMLGLIPYAGHIKPISKAAEHGLSNPRVAQDDTVTWDCIYFGNYWQNDTNGDGKADQNDEKEPIKWRVLSVDGNDAFLLSDMTLDAKPYNEENKFVTWENCTLRNWLNDSFYNIAFTEKEKSVITETKAVTSRGDGVLDKVSILSNIDAGNTSYGFNYDSVESETRAVKNTEYATSNGAFSYKENGYWWLRPYNERVERIYWVSANGNFESGIDYFITDINTAICPCIHINLSSNTWSKADTVTATGGSFVTPTPTATPTPTSSGGDLPPIFRTQTPTYAPTHYPNTTQTPIRTTETASPTITPTPTPKSITAPSKPTKIKAKNSKKKSVTLSWKKVNGATGYQVQYAANTAFAKKKLKSTKKNKLVFKKLKKKKTYSFRVRAYKLGNNVKVYGSWSKAKKVKIKK